MEFNLTAFVQEHTFLYVMAFVLIIEAIWALFILIGSFWSGYTKEVPLYKYKHFWNECIYTNLLDDPYTKWIIRAANILSLFWAWGYLFVCLTYLLGKYVGKFAHPKTA